MGCFMHPACVQPPPASPQPSPWPPHASEGSQNGSLPQGRSAGCRKWEMETNYKGKFLRGWEFGSEDRSILTWLVGIKGWSRLKLVLSDLPLSAWVPGTAIPAGSSVPGSFLLSPIFYAQAEKRVLWVFASASRQHVCEDACVVLNQSEDVTRSSQWITKWERPLSSLHIRFIKPHLSLKLGVPGSRSDEQWHQFTSCITLNFI